MLKLLAGFDRAFRFGAGFCGAVEMPAITHRRSWDPEAVMTRCSGCNTAGLRLVEPKEAARSRVPERIFELVGLGERLVIVTRRRALVGVLPLLPWLRGYRYT